jgi:hypothetical protein
VTVTFAVVLPTWTDNSSHEWMQISAYSKLHLVLQPNQHEYVDGRQQSNTTSVPQQTRGNFSQNLQGKERKEVREAS